MHHKPKKPYCSGLQSVLIACVLSVFWHLPALAKEPVSRQQLSFIVKQDIEEVLFSAQIPRPIALKAADRLSVTIHSIPQEEIDALLAGWIRSTIKNDVYTHLDAFKTSEEVADKFIDEGVDAFNLAFRALAETGEVYREKSQEILNLAYEYRASFNRYLFEKFEPIRNIELEVPHSALPTDTVSGVVKAVAFSLQPEYSSPVPESVNSVSRIDAEIFQLALIRYLWADVATRKLRDERIYGADIVSFLLGQSKALVQADQIRYKSFEEVAPVIDQIFKDCVKIDGDTARINWSRFRGFLTSADLLFFMENSKSLSEKSDVPSTLVKFDTERNKWLLLIKPEEEILGQVLIQKEVVRDK